ncbi:MAG: hypothetical protein ACO2Y9_10460 [Pseudohongiellaceae bacterium]
MKLLTVSLIALSLSFNVYADTAHLISVDGGFRTTHGLSYTITSDQMVATKPKHRTDRFGENPYEISLGALMSEAGVVMIHAERVANQSGASNYEDKPPSDWPDHSFRSDAAVCIDVPASEIEGEHDLEWLQDNGFEPSGKLAYAQYFATTPDFNDEIVITLLAPVSSCGPHIDPATALARLKADLVITLIE